MTIITMSVKRKIGMIEETMGKLINILESVLFENISEQENDDKPKLSDDYSKFGDPDVTPNHVNKDLVLDRHLRNIFKQMKKIKHLEGYAEYVKNNSEDFYYYGDPENKKWQKIKDIIIRIPRFFGGTSEVSKNTATTMIVTFLRNGGYGRDFSKGTLDLSPLLTYDLEARTKRATVTFETAWGEVFADSPGEAMKKFENDPQNWASDSEHEDTEYGDYISIEDVSVTRTNARNLTLSNLGFEDVKPTHREYRQ